jgi:hypothetical protein
MYLDKNNITSNVPLIMAVELNANVNEHLAGSRCFCFVFFLFHSLQKDISLSQSLQIRFEGILLYLISKLSTSGTSVAPTS